MMACPYCGETERAGHAAYQVAESKWLWSCPTWTMSGLRWGSFKIQAEERLAAAQAVCDKWAAEGGIYREQIVPELRAALTGRVLCRNCGHLSDDNHVCEERGYL